jgi:hypothetical protein
LEASGLDGKLATGKYTAAETNPLTKDEDGLASEASFSYSSVVGMLLYMLGHSHPDIAYAMNCCARYMSNSKLSH